ncbi:hypothetical protein ACWDA7_39990 [Streptomyces sp. NPDC001156]
MINPHYQAPQHELNVISSMLRDRSVAYYHFVDWNSSSPDYWLKAGHFQNPMLGRIYDVLLNGGLDEIEQRLWQGAPDHAQAIADVVVQRMMQTVQQEAAAGGPAAWEALNDPSYWTWMHSAIYQLAHPSASAIPEHARHDAYVTVQASQHPSAIEGVPFELAAGRADTVDARYKELAVIGAILDDPSRAEQFRYTPSDPAASPFWLQPGDFGDKLTAEIWSALVTGPDPAIALPAAKDASVPSHQRTQAMIDHIYARLRYSDSHRAAADPDAQARISNGTLRSIAQLLTEASHPNYSPNPDNAALYAVQYILEPAIPAAVEDLAGAVRRDGLADASLSQVAMQLGTREYQLSELARRLDSAPRTLAGYDTAPPDVRQPAEPEGSPAYRHHNVERQVLLSLMREPRQLLEPGPVQSLAAQDFTQPEHRYAYQALQLLRFDDRAVRDPWVITHQAHQLARIEGAPPLDLSEMESLAHSAKTAPPYPTEDGAERLIYMTVRRTVRDATSCISAAVQENKTDPRQLIEYALTQTRQATAEASRHHQQSVPEPSRYAAYQTTV